MANDILKQINWVPEYILEAPEVLKIVKSKIVTTAKSNVAKKVKSADMGDTLDIPFVKGSLGTVNNSDFSANQGSINDIAKETQKAFVGFYNIRYQESDLEVEIGSGMSPLTAARSLLANDWAGHMQDTLVNTTVGCIASNVANEGSDNVKVVNDATFSYGNAVKTLALAGDRMKEFGAVIVNSVVYAQILEADAASITSELDSEIGILREYYNGLELILDDAMPIVVDATNGDRVSTVFIKKGAFEYAPASVKTPLEFERNSGAGNGAGEEIMTSRNNYMLCPMGYSYTGATQAGVTPSMAELADAANWQRVVDAKQAPFVVLETKIEA